MAIGKTKRFEIFKRDGFTCQYCGQRPPEVVLEVDHIHPRAAGGNDDELNLVTSCFDCNRGKRDRQLGAVIPRPDADLKYLETQQEIAEAKRYLCASAELSELRGQIIESLKAFWRDTFVGARGPNDAQWNVWLARYAPEEIEFGLKTTLGKFQAGQFGSGSQALFEAVRYASGVMKKRRQEEPAIQ